MTKRVGVIVLAFGKRPGDEPSPCNRRLARAANDIAKRYPRTLVIAQWECATALDRRPARTVSQKDATGRDRYGRQYLSSQDVIDVAAKVMRVYNATEVIIVANPFLHLWAARQLARKAGFTVLRHRVPWIGFDNSPEEAQWWCKGPVRFILYLGLVATGKILGKNLNGIGEKVPTSPSTPH